MNSDGYFKIKNYLLLEFAKSKRIFSVWKRIYFFPNLGPKEKIFLGLL